MASAKQIAWRKKFARMSKAGVFRTTKKGKARAKETAEYLGGIRRSRDFDALEGNWSTSDPEKYPDWKNVRIALSRSKKVSHFTYPPSKAELKFSTGKKLEHIGSSGIDKSVGVDGIKWSLLSIAGAKDLIRRYKLKKSS